MLFQVAIDSLGGTVFFQMGLCTLLRTMGVKGKNGPKGQNKFVSHCLSGTVPHMIVVFGTQYIDKVCIG